jgi:hypothetical protein
MGFSMSDRADVRNRIIIEGKCGSQPCIRGKRTLVTDILHRFAAGAEAFASRQDGWSQRCPRCHANVCRMSRASDRMREPE